MIVVDRSAIETGLSDRLNNRVLQQRPKGSLKRLHFNRGAVNHQIGYEPLLQRNSSNRLTVRSQNLNLMGPMLTRISPNQFLFRSHLQQTCPMVPAVDRVHDRRCRKSRMLLEIRCEADARAWEARTRHPSLSSVRSDHPPPGSPCHERR